jgi:hypothetical protein
MFDSETRERLRPILGGIQLAFQKFRAGLIEFTEYNELATQASNELESEILLLEGRLVSAKVGSREYYDIVRPLDELRRWQHQWLDDGIQRQNNSPGSLLPRLVLINDEDGNLKATLDGRPFEYAGKIVLEPMGAKYIKANIDFYCTGDLDVPVVIGTDSPVKAIEHLDDFYKTAMEAADQEMEMLIQQGDVNWQEAFFKRAWQLRLCMIGREAERKALGSTIAGLIGAMNTLPV